MKFNWWIWIHSNTAIVKKTSLRYIIRNFSTMEKTTHWTETICAMATPPGIAGLAVIRVSGTDALAICSEFFHGAKPLSEFDNHTIHFGWWKVNGQIIDSVTLTVFHNPNSYTGEDVVEIGCHGGVFVTEQIISSVLSTSARHAEPGEFTKRAFLNGKLDLLQVEAVADIIHTQTRVGAQIAARQLAGGFSHRLNELLDVLIKASSLLEVELDFSEEGYEFVSRSAFIKVLEESDELLTALLASAVSSEILRSGFACAVVGYPNAGKSSLFNALLDRSRAIVSHIPGTTRDYLEDAIVIDGYIVNLYDTAGLRQTEDVIELQGVHLTSSVIQQSNMVLLVNDASLGFDHSDTLYSDIASRFPSISIVCVQNKIDIVGTTLPEYRSGDISCSALSARGVAPVREALLQRIKHSKQGYDDALINKRQASLLNETHRHLLSARSALNEHMDADLIAIDVRSAVRCLGEITGRTWSPDILDAIFSKFCIGK